MAVGEALEDREERADLRDGHHLDAPGRDRVYGNTCGAVAVVEEDLGEHAARRVADDDRGLLQPVDDAAYVLDNGGESQRLYRGRVLAQGLDPALEARAGWGQHPVALGLVALHPLLPAQLRDPESVDQDYCVGGALTRGVVGQGSLLASPSSPEPRECAPESALGVSPKCVISGSNPARLP